MIYNKSKLENLPLGLEDIHYDSDKVKYIDDVEMSRIVFTLNGYQAIRRLQRRMKVRYRIKNKYAQVIQNGCHNWIWKPLCKDGTIGIRPRIDMNVVCEL